MLNIGTTIREQSPGDRQVDVHNFNMMARVLNGLRAMVFDPTSFNVTVVGMVPHIGLRGNIPAAESAWQQVEYGAAVKVSHAPVFWGNLLVDPDWKNHTKFAALDVPAGTPDLISFPTEVTGRRWLYVNGDLSDTGVGGSVTVLFTETDELPLDDIENLVVRRTLSYWEFTAGTPVVGKCLFTTPATISNNLSAVFGPPEAP